METAQEQLRGAILDDEGTGTCRSRLRALGHHWRPCITILGNRSSAAPEAFKLQALASQTSGSNC